MNALAANGWRSTDRREAYYQRAAPAIGRDPNAHYTRAMAGLAFQARLNTQPAGAKLAKEHR